METLILFALLECVAFVCKRLIEEFVVDMDSPRCVVVSWIIINGDVLYQFKSHFTGELVKSCILFQTADKLVNIMPVLTECIKAC